ncbi:MAG: ribosome maturation factor RimP [Pseudobdellovibrio sp.]
MGYFYVTTTYIRQVLLDSEKLDWLNQIEVIASKVAEQDGCILYDVEISGTGNGRALRIFIDKDTGVGIEECTSIAKGLNLILEDKEDLVPGGNYSLEVSSPGLDRSLSKPWHFEKAVGKKIYVKLTQALGTIATVEEKGMQTMKQFEEVLVAATANELSFQIKSKLIKIPLSKIEKSKVVFEMKTISKKN